MERPEKISKLAYYLMDKEPLFYLFIINSDFILDEVCFGSPYAAVKYLDGRVQFHYTSKFIELPIKQLYFVLIHEAYHIFKKHLSLHEDLYKQNSLLLNIAEDAIINTEIIDSKFIGIEPDAKGINPFFVPDDFKSQYSSLGKDAYVTPRLFNWYLQKNDGKSPTKEEVLNKNPYVKNTKTGEYGKIAYETGGGRYQVGVFKDLQELIDHATNKPAYTPTGDIGYEMKIDDLIPVFVNSHSGSFNQAIYDGECESYGFKDTHEQLVEQEEEVQAISQEVFVQKIVKQAREMTDNNPQAQKEAGKGSGSSILEKIEGLMKPEVNWKKVFKRNINMYYSKSSISKTKKKSIITYLMNAKSRNGFIFPHWLKVKDKLQKYIFVAIDTSGSCFSDSYDMERFFSEIDSMAEQLEFSNEGKVYILQWDWRVQSPLREYKKGDWKHFQLNGGGGTNPLSIFRYFNEIFKPYGRSLAGLLNPNDPKSGMVIPDKDKMPFLIVLTDGYFYYNIEKGTPLGHYNGNEDNIMFITKSDRHIFEGANIIKFK